MRWDRIAVIGAVCCVLLLAGAAEAKKRAVELDPGFFTWSKFTYENNRGRPQATPAEILKYTNAFIESYDEVVTYDGADTLTIDLSFVMRLSEDVGADRWALAMIDPSLGESLDLRRAVLRRQGRPDEHYTAEDLIEEAYDPGFDYFSGNRIYYLELPDDRADATLSVDIGVTVRALPGFEGFVRAVRLLQVMWFAGERTLTVRYPTDRPLYVGMRGFTTTLKRRQRDGMEEFTLTLQHLAPADDERWAARTDANYPALLLSSLPDWEAYHALVSEAYESRSVADDAIRANVASLTEGLEGDRERAEALYRFVAGELHYLGMYVGESGSVPHPATEVFARRYGDCKDHTALLVTLLREAGIEAWPVIIHAGEPSFLDPALPVGPTNHVIVAARIDGELHYLDGTSSPYRFDQLAVGNGNREALRIGEGAVEVVTTPVPGADDWSSEIDLQLRVQRDGSLSGEMEVRYDGRNAVRLRERYLERTVADVWEADFDWLAGSFTMPLDATFEDEGEPAAGAGPLTRQVSFRSEEHARVVGPTMLIDLPTLDLPAAIAPQRSPHDFPVFVRPLHYRLSLSLDLPPGYRAVELPDGDLTIWPGGKVEAVFEQERDRIVVEVTGSWTSHRVAAAAAESYAQFRTKLYESLQETLVIRREVTR